MLGANHIPEAEPPDNSTLTLSNSSSSSSSTTLQPSPSSGREFECAFYNPDFIIWSSLGSFYIPCFLMVYLYARIFKVNDMAPLTPSAYALNRGGL